MLDRTFACFGFTNVIVSDNGPPFSSHNFKQYLQEKGIKHRKIRPYWPRANGEAERFVQPLKKIIRTSYIEKKDWKSECHKFLFGYRSTPHSATKVAPADLMFGRKLRTRLPDYEKKITENIHQKLAQNDQQSKLASKAYADQKRHSRERTLNVGEQVIVKQQKKNTLTPNFNPQPYTVTSTKGDMITATNPTNNHQVTCNTSHFKELPTDTEIPNYLKRKEEEEYELDRPHQNHVDINEETPEPFKPSIPRKPYPTRLRRPKEFWKKY